MMQAQSQDTARQGAICRLVRWSKPSKYVIASLITSLAGALFGMDTGTIGPITVMPQFHNSLGSNSASIHGLVVSSILIPAAVTSLFTGNVADSLGRPKTIALGVGVFGVGATIEAAAVSLEMLVVGRVIAGLGEGLFLSTLVVYICEISPPKSRGFLASLPQLVITFFICAGYFICYGSVTIDSSVSWRLPFAIQGLIGFSEAALALLFLPPSPRWLKINNKIKEADYTWELLGVPPEDREVMEEGDAEDKSNSSEDAPWIKRHLSALFMVFRAPYWKQTVLGMFMMGFQQLSGIDGVLYYAPLLFERAGLSSTAAAFLASGGTGLANFLVTIPATIWCDKWGRRTSTILGGVIIFFYMTLIGALFAADQIHTNSGAGRYVMIATIFAFVATYAVTWAITMKVYASEIQPKQTRATASALCYSSNWITNWVVTFTTPIFLKRAPSGAFFMFGASTLSVAVICFLFMPETRLRTLEDITADFGVASSISSVRSRLSSISGDTASRKNSSIADLESSDSGSITSLSSTDKA